MFIRRSYYLTQRKMNLSWSTKLAREKFIKTNFAIKNYVDFTVKPSLQMFPYMLEIGAKRRQGGQIKEIVHETEASQEK